MSAQTGIEWTDRTWNPTRGCSRVSEGCRNCYAERMAARFSRPGMWGNGFASMRGEGKPVPGKRSPLAARWTGRVELIEEKLREPLSWRKPSRVFVNSTSDLFHEKLSDYEIACVFEIIEKCPRHTFQILTKRPKRLLEWHRVMGSNHPLVAIPNVWLGVSVEDQATADERISLLLDIPAAVRFASVEPLLGPVDLLQSVNRLGWLDAANMSPGGIDWVIVGAESGPGARSCDVEWIRSVVGQCRVSNVPCFVKQVQLYRCPVCMNCWERMPEWDAEECDSCTQRARRVLSKAPAEWPADLRVREFPEARS